MNDINFDKTTETFNMIMRCNSTTLTKTIKTDITFDEIGGKPIKTKNINKHAQSNSGKTLYRKLCFFHYFYIIESFKLMNNVFFSKVNIIVKIHHT